MRTLLIITSEDDAHADAAILRMPAILPDWQVLRLNSDSLATDLAYTLEIGSDGDFRNREFSLRRGGQSTSTATVLWYRKPDRPKPHPGVRQEPSIVESTILDYRELILSIEGIFPEARWLNNYWHMVRYSPKLNQLAFAKRHGFRVPETLVTNNPIILRAFAARFEEVVVKPLYSSGFAFAGQQYAQYTNVVPVALLDTISGQDLDLAPCFVQRRIRKALELRVTIFGEAVFACEIRTDERSPEGLDWRARNVEELPHRIVPLPAMISSNLRAILADMGLKFGAFDIILSEDGEYYFIELNPNGQYHWIELLTAAPLTDALLSLVARVGSGE